MNVPIDLYVISVIVAWGLGYWMNRKPEDDEGMYA